MLQKNDQTSGGCGKHQMCSWLNRSAGGFMAGAWWVGTILQRTVVLTHGICAHPSRQCRNWTVSEDTSCYQRTGAGTCQLRPQTSQSKDQQSPGCFLQVLTHESASVAKWLLCHSGLVCFTVRDEWTHGVHPESCGVRDHMQKSHSGPDTQVSETATLTLAILTSERTAGTPRRLSCWDLAFSLPGAQVQFQVRELGPHSQKIKWEGYPTSYIFVAQW